MNFREIFFSLHVLDLGKKTGCIRDGFGMHTEANVNLECNLVNDTNSIGIKPIKKYLTMRFDYK